MLAMANFRATGRNARRNGLQRLLVALAGCCVLSTAFGQSDAPPTDPTVTAAAVGAATGSGADDRLVTQTDPKEVVAANERLVKSTEQEFGKNSRQSAEAYTDLGDAQRRAGDHDAAEKSYLTVVEIYRAIDGPFSPLVIQPLTNLGDNYHEGGDYLEAITAYSEARTVNRRAFGLLNEDQVPLLDRMTRSFVELNKPAEAEAQQLDALRLVERGHAPASDEALGAIYKYAAWLREGGRYQEERDQYARALRTIRDNARQGRCAAGAPAHGYRQQLPQSTNSRGPRCGGAARRARASDRAERP